MAEQNDYKIEKCYYWLKMTDDYFSKNYEIKKLRKLAGGDTYTIIYLKLQLLSIKNEGKIYYEGIENDFCEELALILDEEVDDIKMTIAFLINCGVLENSIPDEYFLNKVPSLMGKETESARRMRRKRAKDKQDKLPEKDKNELLERNNVQQCSGVFGNVTIDRDIYTSISTSKYTHTSKEDSEQVGECAKKNKDNLITNYWDIFYKAYPKKIDKKNACQSYIKQFKGLKTEESITEKADLILSGLNRYIEYWKKSKTEQQYIPYPSTWLNGEKWNDELVVDETKQESVLDPLMQARQNRLKREAENDSR